MPSLVAVCQAQVMNLSEEQRRYEIHARRRRARFERYRDKCNRKLESYSRDNSLNVSYDGSRLEVRVQNPLTHLPEDSGRFTTYEIAIETNNISYTLAKSYVRRRFSEFVWLRKYLKKTYGDISLEDLPPRTLWGGQFDPAVIELRLHGLQKFLKAVLLERVYLSDKALHLFAQTDLSTIEIEDVVEGRDTTSVIDHVLRSAATCRTSTRCSTCSESDLTSEDGSLRVSTSSSDAEASCSFDQCDGASPGSTADKTDQICNGLDPTQGTSGHSDRLSGPRRSVSDSAIVLHMPPNLTDSLESDTSGQNYSREDGESDCSSTSSSSSNASICSRRRQPKSVLSQSLPTSQVNRNCGHRRRRVTFSSEVTVAKVVEKVEEAEGQTVSMVKVRKAKDKTKGH